MKIECTPAEAGSLRAACRSFEEKLIEAIASRQAQLDPEWKAALKADQANLQKAIRLLSCIAACMGEAKPGDKVTAEN
jgi:hypothetical protein